MAISVDKTISKIVENGLCTGCGTCVGICPVDAIEMVIERKKGIYVPQLDEKKCNECGICLRACLGYEVDFEALNLSIFGKEPEDILLGSYLNCYTGYATDYDIRYNSSSGGLVTALLIFALEQGLIDGALVTKMREDRPLEPQPFIARTKQEIISASKSKYCPVPANIALREILKSKDGERFAVVGLPCHVCGLRKAMECIPKLKAKVTLVLGLFCGRTSNFHATEALLARLGIEKEEVRRFDYRGEGWPGKISVCLPDSRMANCAFVRYYEAVFGSGWFHPLRCLTCPDATSELADISFGDAWKLCDPGADGSIIVARSDIGTRLLDRAMSKMVISLEEMPPGAIIVSAGTMIKSKKKQLKPCIMVARLFGHDVPMFKAKVPQPSTLGYIVALIRYLNAVFGRRCAPKLLPHIPLLLLRAYQKFLAGMLKYLT